MRRRTLLEKSLAALVGGVIGGIFLVVLPVAQLWLQLGLPAWPWLLAIPPVIGAAIGYFVGDKGIWALLPFSRRRRIG